jgi:ubiquitin carboxyl-terminal hydrolase 8
MTSFSVYKDKGLSGLANLGNTCFINSCMQIISHTYELNLFLDKNNYKERLNKKSDSMLLFEWDELRKILWNTNCIVSPGKFLRIIQEVSNDKNIDMFTGFDQNDLPEFLIFIIDCFHNALTREVNMTINGTLENETDKMAVLCFEKIKELYSKDYSEIWNLFYGIHVSELKSIDSEYTISRNVEPYFILNLSLPPDINEPTLLDCFDLYVSGEIVEGVMNDKTGNKEDMRKTLSFWSFPNILVIDIKRYNSQNRKKQNMVNFPITNLDLSKYVIGYNKDCFIYDLYGVCNHSGNVLGGHYTSFVKNANDKWYHFNDTNVSEVSDPNSIITPKAYCLFYRKK